MSEGCSHGRTGVYHINTHTCFGTMITYVEKTGTYKRYIFNFFLCFDVFTLNFPVLSIMSLMYQSSISLQHLISLTAHETEESGLADSMLENVVDHYEKIKNQNYMEYSCQHFFGSVLEELHFRNKLF